MKAHAKSCVPQLQRMLRAARTALGEQRQSGRTPATDPLRGVAIEEGEAEGLVAELAADLARPARAGRAA